MLDEFAAGRFELLANGDHLVVFAVGSGTTIEDAFANVNGGHGSGIFFHQFAAKSEQAGDVIPMVRSEGCFGDAGKVELQLCRFQGERVRVRASVEQNAMAVRFDERGKAPFANASGFADEHGGEDSDFEGVNLGGWIGG